MDGLPAQVGRPPVQGRQLGFRLAVPSRPNDAAGCLPGDPPTLLLGGRPRRGVGDPFNGVVGVGDDRPLAADAKVDPAAAIRFPWSARDLDDDRGHRDEQPAALLTKGHRQHPGPALGDHPLQAPSVLLAPEPADDREGEVATVWLKANRASVEPDPTAVAVAGLEPGEPDPDAGSTAMLGCRPGV